MNAQKSLIACAAGLAVAGPLALAGPGDNAADSAKAKVTEAKATHFNPANPFAQPEQSTYAENFDSYAVGQGINGKGNWEIWPGGNDGVVDNAQAFSSANSLTLIPSSDLVQQFSINSGVWEFTIQTYTPSNAPEGEGLFIILLNQWGATYNWSMQIALNDMWSNGSQPDPWLIESQWDGAILPLILDEWVEFKAIFDLDNDTINTFYGGEPLGVDLMWTENNFAAGPGLPQLRALNLYSAAIEDPGMYLDNVSLVELGSCPCACDVDTSSGPGVCDIFDFLGFQNAFVGGETCACDIDTSSGPGVCDIFDFLAFQDEFVSGCP